MRRLVQVESFHLKGVVSVATAKAVADVTAGEAKYFTVMYATKRYHQCPLTEDSQDLTTFITPFGWFKYLRAS